MVEIGAATPERPVLIAERAATLSNCDMRYVSEANILTTAGATYRHRVLPRHLRLELGSLLEHFEQHRHLQSSRRFDENAAQIVPRDLRETPSKYGSNVPVTGEDDGVVDFVGLKNSSEPGESTRDVVELTCFGRRAKYASIVAEE